MLKNSNGVKVCPRQLAAEELKSRIGIFHSLDQKHEENLTEREIALVNRQLEKLYSKINKLLDKALRK